MADMLATLEDLTKLLPGVDSDTGTMLLELATSRVQRAAGGQRILEVTDTAIIDVRSSCDPYLPLPQLPVMSVDTVLLDGTAITDWYVREQQLWRASGWMASWSPPSQATVTYTHGHPDGSQYLQLARDATLSLAVVGAGNPTAATSEQIDDYRVTYADADARMQMTESLREAIAGQYGTSTYITGSR